MMKVAMNLTLSSADIIIILSDGFLYAVLWLNRCTCYLACVKIMKNTAMLI